MIPILGEYGIRIKIPVSSLVVKIGASQCDEMCLTSTPLSRMLYRRKYGSRILEQILYLGIRAILASYRSFLRELKYQRLISIGGQSSAIGTLS